MTKSAAAVDKVRGIIKQQVGAIQGLRAEIDRIRAEIAGLTAQREEIERSPRPLAEAMAGVDAYLTDRAARYLAAVPVGGFLHPGYDGEGFDLTPYVGSRFVEQAHGGISLPMHDIEGFVCAMLPDAIRERFRWLLTEKLKGQAPVALAERRRRLAELERQQLELEHTEEAIIVAAEAAGLALARRADADPRAILEMAD